MARQRRADPGGDASPPPAPGEVRGPAALPRPVIAVLVGAAAVFAWYSAGFATFTWPARVAVFVAGVAVLVAAAVIPKRPERSVPRRPGVWAWVLWCAAVAGWELFWLFGAPRADHPTISSLVNALIAVHPARAAAVLLWLVAGWWVARR